LNENQIDVKQEKAHNSIFFFYVLEKGMTYAIPREGQVFLDKSTVFEKF